MITFLDLINTKNNMITISISFINCACFIILSLISCSPDEDRSIQSEVTFVNDYELSIEAHPENSLIANLYISTTEPSSVIVSWFANNTAVLSKESAALEYYHNFTIIAMRPERTYNIEIIIDYADGDVVTLNKQFDTGILPANAPTIELLESSTGSLDGITLFGIIEKTVDSKDQVTYWGVDNDGQIVWFLHGTNTFHTTPLIRAFGTEALMVFLNNEVRIITSAGETITSYEVNSEIFHHDAIILPNDNLLLIAEETRTLNGNAMMGDKVIESNKEGKIIWEWSTFDHLDTLRFPSELSLLEDHDGYLDWTHCNSIYYIEEENSFLISCRNQNWVIKVSRSSGEVIWIFGNDDQVLDDFNNDFFRLIDGSWFNSQHACALTNDKKLMIYDNRNETGGDKYNSRAVIYSLQEKFLTATQEWEYIAPKYTASFGDVDELPNGNILVCAGGPGSDFFTRILEVSRDTPTTPVMDLQINGEVYRAEKISWNNFLLMSDLK